METQHVSSSHLIFECTHVNSLWQWQVWRRNSSECHTLWYVHGNQCPWQTADDQNPTATMAL